MVRYVAVVSLILTVGIVISRGGGVDLEDERLPTAGALPEEGLVETISEGEPVDVESHLDEGYAVVEFKADW
ncbi:MAG: hypothetical protein ACYTGN_10050 [Planctomycetota bacterium]|jgi:hypothetical protein